MAEPRVKAFGVTPADAWHAIEWVPIRTHASLLKRLLVWRRFAANVARVAARFGPFERVFVGHDGTPMRHIVNITNPREVVFLDTGLATAEVARRRLRQHATSQLEMKRRVKEFALGLRLAPIKKVTFFSSLPIDVHPPDLLVHTSFEAIRRNMTSVSSGGETWVLGQNFVAGGMMPADVYSRAIREICERSPAPHVYIAHPREEEARLAAIKRDTGVAIRRLQRPVELELVASGILPRALWGINSTALFSCATIFAGLPVYALRLPMESFVRYAAGAANAYSLLAGPGTGVSVVTAISAGHAAASP